MVKQTPLRVEADHLAARAKAGIDGEHRPLAEGRSEEELSQVGGENGGGRLVGGGLQPPLRLGLEGGREEPAVCIDRGLLELGGSLSPAAQIPRAKR